MSDKQPNALRLANILCNDFDTYTDTWSAKEASEELRRLHNLNEELFDTLVKAREDINYMLNSRSFLNGFVFDYVDDVITKARGEYS